MRKELAKHGTGEEHSKQKGKVHKSTQILCDTKMKQLIHLGEEEN